MNHIEHLTEAALARHEHLFAGVDQLRYVDYPDHPNVGDSAIALGQLRFFELTGRKIESVHCIGTFHPSLLKRGSTVVIHGGGNISGFFEQIDRHRYTIARGLDQSVRLIQAPQSVHHTRPGAEQTFLANFASRTNLRMAVRDKEAFDDLTGHIPDLHLAPDAAHMLGAISAPSPTDRLSVLLRRDAESQRLSSEFVGADWLKDESVLRGTTWVRWKVRFAPRVLAPLNPKPERWKRISKQRLARGVALLAPGEVVVTDRLHAMLIALQMGRRVVAVDNNNRKLSKYASTWFDARTPVDFAGTPDEALRIAKTLHL